MFLIFIEIALFSLFFLFLDKKASGYQKVLFGALSFFSLTLFKLDWLTLSTYHGKLIWAIWVLASLLLSLQFALFLFLLFLEKKITIKAVYGLASFWTLCEMSRLNILSGFPFFPLAEFFEKTAQYLQFASVLGIYGLSFIFILSTLLLYGWLKERDQLFLLHLVAIHLVLIFYGNYRLEINKELSCREKKILKVSLIQTGWTPEKKYELAGFDRKTLSSYQMWEEVVCLLKKNCAYKSDLIILPESSITMGAQSEVFSLEKVQKIFGEIPLISNQVFVSNLWITKQLANYCNASILIGLDDFDEKTSQNKNALFLVRSNSEDIQEYCKNILVPFGEYLPFKFLKKIACSYGLYSFYSKGKSPLIFIDQFKMAPSICYEEYFSSYIRGHALLDAQMLVNSTNDGWFYGSTLSSNHFFHAKLRSIELGLLTLRSCNTGISGVIDPCGNVLAFIASEKEDGTPVQASLTQEINVYKIPTLYLRFGMQPLIMLCLFLTIYFLKDLLYRRKMFFFKKNL